MLVGSPVHVGGPPAFKRLVTAERLHCLSHAGSLSHAMARPSRRPLPLYRARNRKARGGRVHRTSSPPLRHDGCDRPAERAQHEARG